VTAPVPVATGPATTAPSVLTLPDEWEAEASSPRGPLTADLELEGAQVRRVLAAQLRERLADPKTVFGLLLEERDRLAAENERLAEGGRILGRTLNIYVRSMYALWIDAQRGDLTAANSIFEALDGFDGPDWDGKETGFGWLERTRDEDDNGEQFATVLKRYRAALEAIEPAKLEFLADWWDMDDAKRGRTGTEVQEDLRRWAHAVR